MKRNDNKIVSSSLPFHTEANQSEYVSPSKSAEELSNESVENTPSASCSQEDIPVENIPPSTSKEASFQKELSAWCIKYNISHTAINSLISLIDCRFDLYQFTGRDARAILGTPRTVTTSRIGEGNYWYYGIKTALLHHLHDIKSAMNISLNINIDGLPLFNSSKTEFWPILISINEIQEIPPMAVAIYCGKSKPPLDDFLSPFVEELKTMIEHGFNVEGHEIGVKVRCFICDTPARSFIKGAAAIDSQ